MKKSLTILDAMDSPDFFGGLPAFADPSTWTAWRVFLKAVHGLPMDHADRELFRQHTGRQEPRADGYPESCVIVGRQSGKSLIAATVGVFEAARAVMSGERGVYVPLVAQDLRGAQRALLSYVKEAVQSSDLLRREITRETATELELAGRVTLAVYPCRPAAVRGIRAAFVAIDELAFFTATDGRPTDLEMLRAVRPMLATTGGRLLILSSPYAQQGALYDLHRRHYGSEDSDVLVWQASAPEMNPTLPRDYLERMQQDDPEAYRSEVLGEFRAGVSTFLDPEVLGSVIEAGTRSRPPSPGHEYFGFIDGASGSGKDAFAVAIGHQDGGQAVLDVVQAWTPPFNPSGVVAECAELLRLYRVGRVEADGYAFNFLRERFAERDIIYTKAPRPTVATYMELLPLLNAGVVVLLDDPDLLRELRGLERWTGRAGRDTVKHRHGSHDDRATAAAGVLVAAAKAFDEDEWDRRERAAEAAELHELETELHQLEQELFH